MSTGTICLTCRQFVGGAEDSRWRCRCENPQPSNDGQNLIGQEDYAEFEVEKAKDELFQAEYRTRMTRALSDEDLAHEMYDAGYEAGKPKWIPVRSEDDLPKDIGRMYATITSPRNPTGRVIILNLAEKPWYGTQIIAWQPLPDPYQQEGE